MSRKYNFCAGPASLPEEVLLEAQRDLLDWKGKGLSVMEMSHRSSEFEGICKQAEQDLRDLLAVPKNYRVLFMQGGASLQFAAVPLNLLGSKKTADYVNTGQWSIKAIAEAKKFCDVNVVATSESTNFATVPAFADWKCNKDAAYLHYTPNETIGGLEFSFVPETGDVPLVADMSSTILSRPVDVSKFGLIYAGAQKNIGPAGLVVVIVREDLLSLAPASVPTMLNYKIHADNDSLYNTPPSFSVYLAGLVFAWLKKQGGLSAIGDMNRKKAETLYQYIDNSGFYSNPVELQSRSWMNVPFCLKDEALDKPFLAEAEKAGLLNLKGHRSVGGMRASIYNAVTPAAVDVLVSFMRDFQKRHGG